MKIKLLVISAALLLLSGCYETVDNVSVEKPVQINKEYSIKRITVDSHDYIDISDTGYTHSGSCRKCKQERDSIVNLVIKSIKGNDN